MKKITMHKDHAYVSARTAETCSGGKARSYLNITAPRNTRLHIPRRFIPKIKLLDGAGAQVERSTDIYVRKLRPNDKKPVYLADFTYVDFADLDPAAQDNRDNRDALTVDLGKDITVNPMETISIEIVGPDPVDWDNVDTIIKFAVAEEVL